MLHALPSARRSPGLEHHHAGSDISPPARFAFARRGSGPASLQAQGAAQLKADDQDSRGKGGEPPQLRDRSRESRFEKAHLRAEDQTDMTPEEMFAVDHTRRRISVRMRSLTGLTGGGGVPGRVHCYGAASTLAAGIGSRSEGRVRRRRRHSGRRRDASSTKPCCPSDSPQTRRERSSRPSHDHQRRAVR